MKRKLSSLFLIYCSSLFALPEGSEVAAGSAEFKAHEKELEVHVHTDRAIINYQNFDVAEGETVRFIQPHKNATLLNRVTGKDPSKIYGTLTSNGRLFLVNPYGIYIGPEGVVRAGSFLASTLNIKDEDFLQDRFTLMNETDGKIINEGEIRVDGEGFVALLSPHIENRGVIYAKEQKILLAAAEKITLDFSGDGLIQFIVDGELEKALIENGGLLSSGSGVTLSLKTAERAIKSVVNMDDLDTAQEIQIRDGLIRLVGKSVIEAPSIIVEGEKTEVSGHLQGNQVTVLGDQITLKAAHIDASSVNGGGTVLIGGDYQGKGPLLPAIFTTIDENSTIYADATERGNGGKVIVWADDTTLFDGKIFARGGSVFGDGGFIETSGKINLGVNTGFVNTLSPNGKAGDWLLDPSSITIATLGLASIAQCSAPNCSNTTAYTIAPLTIGASLSNVALCAQSSATSTITVSNPVSMLISGVSLSLTAGSSSTGTIALNANITTIGGAININGAATLGANITLDTTNGGLQSTGASVNFSNTINGAQSLTVNGGTSGVVTFSGAIGGTTALTSLSATGANIIQSSTANVTGTINYIGSGGISLGGSVLSAGTALVFTSPVTLVSPVTVDTTFGGLFSSGAAISFGSTLNGAFPLTLTAGTGGTVTFSGAVGSSTPLSSLTASGATVTQNSTIKTTGAISLKGTSAINLGNNLTSAGGAQTYTGPVTLAGSVIADTTNSGAVLAGAGISFTGNITQSGTRALSLNGGTGGAISVGGNLAANALTITNSANTTITGTTTVPTVTLTNTTGTITFNGAATISTALAVNGLNYGIIFNNGGVITPATTFANLGTLSLFSGTSSNLTFTNGFTHSAGPTTILGTVLSTNSTSGITLGATTFSSGTSILRSNAGPISMGAVTLSGNTTIDTTNNGGTAAGAGITFSSTINGANPLTINAGTGGTVAFNGIIGGSTPIGALTITNANNLSATTISATSITQSAGSGTTTLNGAVNTTGSAGVVLTGAVFTINNPLTTTNSGPITITNSGTLTIAGAINASGSFTQNGTGLNAISANITGSSVSILQGISLGSAVQISNGGGSGIVTLSSTVNGGQAFTIVGGTGSTTLVGPIGASTALASLTLNAGTLSIGSIGGSSSGVSGTTSLGSSAAITFTGSTYNANTQNYTAATNFNMNAGALTTFSGNSNPITFTTGAIQLSSGTNLTIATGNGSLTVGAIDAVSGNLSTLNLNSGSAPLQVGAIGTASVNEFASTILAGSNILIRGNIVSNAVTLTPTGTIYLGASITTSNSSLVFPRPVIRDTTSAVTVSSGSTGANITFQYSIDGDTSNTRNLTVSAGTTGSIAFNGVVGGNNPLLNLSIGSAFNVTVANSGTPSITAGSITQTAGLGTTTFNGPLLTTTSSGIVLTGTNFALNSAITTQNSGPLTINHSGNLAFTSGTALNLTGPFTDNGTGSATTSLAGSITTNGNNILFAKAVALIGTTTLNSSGSVGNITFSSTLDGNQTLNLAAGGGNITFTGAVGTTPLGAVNITSAANVTLNALSASTLTQSAGTGVTTFNGAVNLTGGGTALSLIGTNATVNNSITTTNGGAVSFNVSSTLVHSSSASLNLGGGFTQSGSGSAQISGSISTTNSPILFTGGVLFSAATTLNTGSANISFLSTIDGPGALNLTLGTGSLTLSGAAGSSTRLGAITINSVGSISTQGINAFSITQSVAATGSASYGGSLNTTGASGISLIGTSIAINGSLITTNSGPVSIVHSGPLNLTAGSGTSISGAFSESGGGGVNLSGTMTTASGAITFNDPISLSGTTSLGTGIGSGNILFNSTIDGAQTLNLTAGAGTITFSQVVGGTTPLSAVNINTAGNVSIQNLSAGTVTQNSGSGTTTINGTLTATGTGGVNLTGSGFYLLSSSSIIANGTGGPIAINNTGAFNLMGNISANGAFTQLNTGTVTLSGTVSAAGISFAAPLILSGTSASLTATGVHNITIGNTIDGVSSGSGNLSVTAPSGNILFSAAIGSSNRIGVLTIANAVNVSLQALTGSGLIQQNGSGTTSGVGAFNIIGSTGINLNLNNYSRNGTVTISGGSYTINNTGTYTGTVNGMRNITGGSFLQMGSGPVTYSGSITATGNIEFAGSVVLNGTLSLTSSGGGTVSIPGTINGAQPLAISTSGTVSFGGVIGGVTPPSSITINNASSISVSNPITAGTFVQNTTGSASYLALTTTGSGGISLTGSSITLGGAISTSNAGPVVITNSGLLAVNSAITSAAGGFSQTGSGLVNLGANITTPSNPISFASAVTLTGPVTLNSGTGTAPISFSSTVNGAQNLTVAGGGGNVTFGDVIGGVSPLSSLTISGNNITLVNIGSSLAAGVTGSTSITALDNLNFNGTVYHCNGQSYSGAPIQINTPTTFISSNDSIAFAGSSIQVGSGASLTVNSSGGPVSLTSLVATANSLSNVTINAGAGSVTTTSIGVLGQNEFGTISITSGDVNLTGPIFAGTLTLIPTGNIYIGNNITTSSSMNFPRPAIRNNINTVTLTTPLDITFVETLSSDSNTTPRNIIFSARDITFSQAVGGTPLSLQTLTISTARNVSIGAINAQSIVQSAGTGTTTFHGQITTTGVGGISLTGTGFSFTNGVDTSSGGGSVTIANSGTLSINSSTAWNLGGVFSQTTSNPVCLAVSIVDPEMINFTGPISIIGATSLDTSSGSGSISLNNTVDSGVSSSNNLTINTGTSDFFCTGNVGDLYRLGNLTVNGDNITFGGDITATDIALTGSSTGTMQIAGNINSSGSSGITLVMNNLITGGNITTSNNGPFTLTNSGSVVGAIGSTITVSGNLIQNGSGPMSYGGSVISLNGNMSGSSPLTLLADTSFTTSNGNGNITFFGTVDGAYNLSLNSGSGFIDLKSAIGSKTPLTSMTIVNAGNVTIESTLTALSILQSMGSGTTTFLGNVTASNVGGISLTTQSVAFGGSVSANSGPLVLALQNSGSLSFASSIAVSGGLTQTGSCPVSLGGLLTSTNNGVSFAGPLTLTGNTSINTGNAGGSISLNGGVNGNYNLTLLGGTGNITLGAIGSTTPINNFVITSAANVTTAAISASSITQQAGTGTTTFSGVLTTGAISLTGSSFTIGNTVTSTGVTVHQTGTLTLTAGANLGISGAFNQTTTGLNLLNGAITTSGTGTITFTGASTISSGGTASLTTANQNIQFLNTLDGPGNLNLNAGSGNISFSEDLGDSVSLGTFTIQHAQNVTTQALNAGAIVQSTGSGTTTIGGNLIGTSISLTNSTISLLGNATATSGAMAFVGPLVTANGKTLSSATTLSQSGGTVSLGSSLSGASVTIGGAITLTAPVTFTGSTTLSSTMDGPFDVTVNAGTTGNVIFNGAIGGVTRIGNLLFTSVDNANLNANITASSMTLNNGLGLFSMGTNSSSIAINTNGSAGISLTGNNFFRNGSFTTTNGGGVFGGISGSITGVGGNTTSIDGTYVLSTTNNSPINLGGTITARQGISINMPIKLVANAILDTSNGNGSITLSTSVDNSSLSPAYSLTLRSGGGNISLTTVGQTFPIGALLFGNINNVTAGNISALSIGQESSTTIKGSATFNGGLTTTGSSGIVLTGSQMNFNGNILTTGNGPLSITDSILATFANGIAVSIQGALSQSGTGSVSMGSALTGASISFASPISLTADTSMNATSGNISLAGVGGAYGLMTSCGLGALSLQGKIGQGNLLTNFTVSNAATLSALSQIEVTGAINITVAGTSTFNDTLMGNTISLTTGGNVAIKGSLEAATSITQTISSGTPKVTLQSPISAGGNISIASPVTLSNDISIESTSGNISFATTIDSDLTQPRGLLIQTGGNVSLGGSLGSINPLSTITINADGSISTLDMSAVSIGAGLFSSGSFGALTTSGSSGIALSGGVITLNGLITTTGSGTVVLTHTGNLTQNAAMNLQGAFTESGGGTVYSSGSITTQANSILWNGAYNLTNNVTMNTTSGTATIHFVNTIDGPYCLTTNAHSGQVIFDAAIGSNTPLGCFAATGATIDQNSSLSTTGTVAETGAITLGGNITTVNSDLTLTGPVLAAAPNLTLSTGSGSGNIELTQTLNAVALGDNFTINAGTGNVLLQGVTGGVIPFHNFTVLGTDITWNNFGSVVQGASGTCAITATDTITFTGTSYTNSTQNYTATNGFQFTGGATSISSDGAPITFSSGTLNLGSTLSINSNGGNVNLSNVQGAGQTLNVSAGTGTVTVANIGTSGALAAVNVSAQTLIDPGTYNPPISFTPTSITLITSTPFLVSSPINSPLVIGVDDLVITLTNCGGATPPIVFNSTIDSDNPLTPRSLTINACTQTVTFNATVGGSVPLNAITINNDSGVTAKFPITSNSFTELTTNVGSTTNFEAGLTTLTGNLSLTTDSITLQGGFDIAGNMNMSYTGTLTAPQGTSMMVGGNFQESGGGSATLSGSIQTTGGSITFEDSLALNGALSCTSNGGNISFAAVTGPGNNLSLNAGSGNINLASIGASSASLGFVTIVAAQNMTSGAIHAASFAQQSGSGTTSFSGNLSTTGSSGINLVGNNFTNSGTITTATGSGGNLLVNNAGVFQAGTIDIDGAFSQTGAGTTNVNDNIVANAGISFIGPVVATGASSFDTSAGNGNISLASTLGSDGLGSYDITFNSGTGNISLTGAVGTSSAFLGDVLVTEAQNLTTNAIFARSLTQSAGSALSRFKQAVTVTDSIYLSGTNLRFDDNITAPGGVTLTIDGSLILNGSTISANGGFSELGSGTVSLASSISSVNNQISFTNPVALTSGISLTSSGGEISFSNTLNGSQNLTLTAGSGTIQFGGVVGGVNPLGNIQINSVAAPTYTSITASSFTQSNATGLTTITGPIVALTGGVSISGAAVTQNGSVTALAAGSYTVTHSGLLTFGSLSSVTANGGFTSTGSGAVSLAGSILTNNGPISFGTGAITLANGSTTFNTGSGSGSITVNGTIDGNQNLTLLAGEGSVAFNGAIGGTTPIGALTISNAENVTTGILHAASITQSAGAGLTNFTGAVVVTDDVDFTGSALTIGADLSADNLLIVNTGNFINNGSITLSGNFSQTGSGSSTLAGSLEAAGTVLFTAGVVTNGASVTTDNMDITFLSDISGSGNLTLASGTADILLSGTTTLGNLTFSSARNITAQAITANQLTQTAGTGLSFFQSPLNITENIHLSGTNFTFSNATTAGGSFTINHSGSLAINENIVATGGFSQTGSGTVTLSGNITTTGTDIDFASLLNLGASVQITTNGGNFNLTETLAGAQSITMNTGAGNVNFGANMSSGNRLNSIVFGTIGNAQLYTLYARDITITNSTGTVNFGSTSGSDPSITLNTNGPNGINVNGNNFFRHGNFVTTNGGNFEGTVTGTITGVGTNSTSIDGFYIVNAPDSSSFNFIGSATARLGITINAPINLAGTGTFTTADAFNNLSNGVVTITKTLNGAHDFTIETGQGIIDITNTIGAITPLSSLTLTGLDITLPNIGTSGSAGVSGTILIPAVSDPDPNGITFTGTVYNANTQNYLATTSFSISSGSTTTFIASESVTFSTGPVIIGNTSNLTIDALENISLGAISSGTTAARALVLHAGGGLQVGQIGTAGATEFASTSLTGTLNLTGSITSNSISFNPTGTMQVGGNLTTVNTDLIFPNPVELTQSCTFSTGTGAAGTITFNSTVDSDSTTRNLTLSAGTGNIVFDQVVGGTNPLGLFTILSAYDVTASSAIFAESLAQISGTDSSTFQNITTTGVSGITLIGENITLAGVTDTTAGPGSLTISNSGLFTLSGSANLGGAFIQNGIGSNSFSGSIISGQSVSFATSVTLLGTSSIDTSSNNQNIIFTSPLTGSGSLTLTAGTGDIDFTASASLGSLLINSAHDLHFSAVSSSGITVSNSSGTAFVNGNLSAGAAGINLSLTNLSNTGSYITTSGGPLSISGSGLMTIASTSTTSISGECSISGSGILQLQGPILAGSISIDVPVTLTGNTTFNTSVNGGNISLIDTINGFSNLTCLAGTGDISIDQALGGTTALNAVTLSSSSTITVSDAVIASSITQNGAGSSTFYGNLTTNGSLGISLSGTAITRAGGSWITTNSGPISITNNGTFTSEATGTINAAGGFTQSGLGAVQIGQTISTTSAPVSFSGAVTLLSDLSITTGGGLGDITFNNSIDGDHNLTLTAGSGSIEFMSLLGGTTPLDVITITTAQDVTTQGITASALVQSQGSGTTTLNGITSISSSEGISLIGNNLTLNGIMTTALAGPLNINNSGLLQFGAGATINGAILQEGVGPCLLSGSFTSVTSSISFASAITSQGNPTFVTSSQPISFASTINGSGGLSLTAGSGGNISFEGAIGASTQIGALAINSAHNVTVPVEVQATTITQISGSGTTSFTGGIATSGAVNLSGTNFTVSGLLTTGGSCSINHTGTLILEPNSLSSITGTFSDSGSGSTSFSGTLSGSSNITLNRPITLIGTSTISSLNYNLTLGSTVQGPFNLTLGAGTGSIFALGTIGNANPNLNLSPTSVTISNALNVSLQDVYAASIVQLAGTGTTLFNGLVTTTAPIALNLIGSGFTFKEPVTTQNGGSISISNSGTLTIESGAAFTMTGAFLQTGAGEVLLADNIETSDSFITFAGPVVLEGDATLTTGSSSGVITFEQTVVGSQNLTLSTGSGRIVLNSGVGSTVEPLGVFTINSDNIFSSHNIIASSVNISSVSGLATFNGTLTTTGMGGITLGGQSFTFNGDVVTTNSGGLTIDNLAAVTFGAGISMNLSGPFLQSGSGSVLLNGTLTTTNQDITFTGPIILVGNSTITSGSAGGNIEFNNTIDGAYNLDINAGSGSISFSSAVGDGTPLVDVTLDARNVNLNGVGNLGSSSSSSITASAANSLNLSNAIYIAGTQTFSAGTGINLDAGAQVNIFSLGGDINFDGSITLSPNSSVNISTDGGGLSHTAISTSAGSSNVTISTGSGTVQLADISSSGSGTINNVTVSGGSVVISGSVNTTNLNVVSNNAIMNDTVSHSSPYTLNSSNSVYLNALGGNVGSLEDPINVTTLNQISVGSTKIAAIDGSSGDNTVHPILPNPPCLIVFNGVTIQDTCGGPSPAPTPSSPAAATEVVFYIPYPGMNSSYYNFSSDYYFFTDFITDCDFEKECYNCYPTEKCKKCYVKDRCYSRRNLKNLNLYYTLNSPEKKNAS